MMNAGATARASSATHAPSTGLFSTSTVHTATAGGGHERPVLDRVDRRDLESCARVLAGLAGLRELLRRAPRRPLLWRGAALRGVRAPQAQGHRRRRAVCRAALDRTRRAPALSARRAPALAEAAPDLREQHERSIPRGANRPGDRGGL